MKKKQVLFIKTMHLLTSRWKRWLKYTNSISNCFCTHNISQIWLPVTFSSKKYSRGRDLDRMNRSSSKQTIVMLEKAWIDCITLRWEPKLKLSENYWFIRWPADFSTDVSNVLFVMLQVKKNNCWTFLCDYCLRFLNCCYWLIELWTVSTTYITLEPTIH